MSKQHYQVATYRAQHSVGYLIKRAHSMMLDTLEQIFEERGFSFIQYVILSWLRSTPRTSASSSATTAVR